MHVILESFRFSGSTVAYTYILGMVDHLHALEPKISKLMPAIKVTSNELNVTIANLISKGREISNANVVDNIAAAFIPLKDYIVAEFEPISISSLPTAVKSLQFFEKIQPKLHQITGFTKGGVVYFIRKVRFPGPDIVTINEAPNCTNPMPTIKYMTVEELTIYSDHVVKLAIAGKSISEVYEKELHAIEADITRTLSMCTGYINIAIREVGLADEDRTIHLIERDLKYIEKNVNHMLLTVQQSFNISRIYHRDVKVYTSLQDHNAVWLYGKVK